MKKNYEAPLLEVIELSTECGILENSLFVKMALIGEEPGVDSRNMTINDSAAW